ncbi:MAG TPA: NADP-dependent oxidoreductase [Solirubrobacterales bacterium]|jgi:NADPH:quinone reductase-like Zn-dependent oxidoreductase|nr:NADP-dependent oxidoreductase [Solirubrobacterales bacterium]
MQAVVAREHGGPEVLELREVERPGPYPTEVLVRVAAAGINPVDWKTRSAPYLPAIQRDPPLILGWDVAGTVEEVGYGVTRFAPGDRVFGMPWFPRLARAYAEYVTAPSRQFASTPESLDDVHAGALPLAGLTARQSLVDTAGVGEGDRVLIHAAAGGVGHLAVQIAKARGAYVIGTARAEKHEFLRGLGVDEAVDYAARPFDEIVSDVDVVVDLVGGDDYGLRSLRTLREGGLLIEVPSGASEAVFAAGAAQSKRVTGILVEPDYAGLEALASLADSGRLEVAVEATFPLARAADAHAQLESGRARGKLVLIV